MSRISLNHLQNFSKFQLCSLAPTVCSLLKVKTNGPVDVTPFVQKEPIDIGALPIPQLGGDWKIGGKITQNGKTLAGVQIGNGKTWLNIYVSSATLFVSKITFIFSRRKERVQSTTIQCHQADQALTTTSCRLSSAFLLLFFCCFLKTCFRNLISSLTFITLKL